jgi:hypothetical protein
MESTIARQPLWLLFGTLGSLRYFLHRKKFVIGVVAAAIVSRLLLCIEAKSLI